MAWQAMDPLQLPENGDPIINTCMYNFKYKPPYMDYTPQTPNSSYYIS
jgi:hypothetical protein